jgi:hypothetical protein
MSAPGKCHRDPRREGVLLLLVLIALTLFLMLGVALLVKATRSRTAARSFGARTDALEAYTDRAALDEALMVLLRGSRNTLPPQISESILADRYGSGAVTGTVSGLAGGGTSPILTATLPGLPAGVSAAARLNGRVLTLVPGPGAGSVASFRILAASGSAPCTVQLSNVPFRPGLMLPSGSCEARINGRDFAGTFPANEPWDGFTTGSAVSGTLLSDPWLARVELASGAVTNVRQATYQTVLTSTTPAALPLECDNDNDGVADGVWIDGTAGFLAPRPSPHGGRITNRVSYLVLDLDGRLNVNAAGMAAPAPGSYANSPDTPLGMGYGPADIDASLLFPATLPPASGLSAFTSSGAAPTGMWWSMLAGGSSSPGSATTTQRRPPPGVGAFSGRYGPNGVPGAAGDDPGLLQSTTGGRYAATVAGANAVADLKGHMRMYMTATISGTANTLTPRLTWFVPAATNDESDDPYEVRLDAGAPRLGSNVRTSSPAGVNDDLPYNVGELERVLRANDPDAPMLAQRLAAALGTNAQAQRMLITTDSWDTPGLTGTAAGLVENRLASHPPTYPWTDANAWSPDVAAGLRFNINRPVLSGSTADALAQQPEYCKSLYTLVRALGESDARRAAQWAVNVLDFRDEDSTMTRFVYDADPFDFDGWNVTGTTTGTVWGVERPDLVIVDTAAWRGISGSSALYVGLTRAPFAAERVVVGSGTGARERIDPVMRNGTDLQGTLSATGTAGTFGVWQLRFADDRAVPFRPLTGSSTQTQWFVDGTQSRSRSMTLLGNANGLSTNPLSAASSLSSVVVASADVREIVNTPSIMLVNQGGRFEIVPPATSGTVMLERLADPSRANGPDNPYIVIDTAPVELSTSGSTPGSGITWRRRRPGPRDSVAGRHALAAFWQQPANIANWIQDSSKGVPSGRTGTPWLFQLYFQGAGMVAGTPPTNDPVPWFHWPNRPFVSTAELALVPADDANGLLRNYSMPTTSLVNGPLGHLILDATIVPSRFAGTALTVSATTGTTAVAMQNLGLDRLRAGQFPTWREPGRMNVNTLPTGTAAATDGLLWQLLVGGTQTVLATGAVQANPFTATGTFTPTPARSLRQILALSGGADGPPAIESVPTTIVVSSGTTLHPRAKNPFLAMVAANRLANCATIRSNMFAAWITVETTDSSPGAPPPVTRRLFAIIDRSIPVGYSQGEDLNVRDTIRLVRYLD